ncbi:Xaa-Pro peptidase family protein [Paenibacillus sp. J5C_2022]|uniref:M24 family metallopeptidase n=1 Tax=Paenibacillus sp. J5C2022 TaxID=2977129 RepID=UPI0021CF3237|nr:Xaa-Pro peptidase family protein [Paenibacillus sp. J5C2022]MCU6711226.1 Xaa-Pro peptidase family protein [Paenibacillus sp. J5C2022]
MEALNSRLTNAVQRMRQQGVDALVVGSVANFYYFTGKWIEPHERLLALVIRGEGEPLVVSPEMHRQDFEHSTWECLFWWDGEDAMGVLSRHLQETGTVAIDSLWSSGHLLSLMKCRPRVAFVDGEPLLSGMRQVKDETELAIIREAGGIADRVMGALMKSIAPGMRERELVELLGSLWKKEGVYEQSFAPIVAAGANGARPHHVPDDTVVKDGDMIILDIGGRLKHYCSDMTRTVCVGSASDEMRTVYELVRAAQQAGLDAVKPGVPFSEVDRAVRDVITAGGYGDYFTHRTGHGLGIDVHELPSVHGASEAIVEQRMVFSVEPGIYLPGRFGVRIEDIVIVTESGCEPVNKVAKDLLIV